MSDLEHVTGRETAALLPYNEDSAGGLMIRGRQTLTHLGHLYFSGPKSAYYTAS
ncbi:MAG: hypothetical protein JO217_01620 [Acidobacteriaceae bacterium]|nr:hypothetical protein [Acidobacteriaceae bacterium]